MSVDFTCGDKEEAISVMREAAGWLVDIGRPLWDEEDLSPERLGNPPDEFWVLREDGRSAAAMILSYEDRFFWPDIPPGVSGFIHKLSVRREFASRGYAKMAVEQAKAVCRSKNIKHLRLDCDPHREGLLTFYKSCGFTLVEKKVIHTEKWGRLDLALFETEC